MSDASPRPQLGSNFRVEIDAGNGHVLEIGCCEVLFPSFRVPADAWQAADTARDPGPLTLRRASGGGTELYDWWDQARRGRAPKRRTLHVTLLADDRASVVLRWRFLEVRPVALGYSPLRSMESALVIESIELAFESIEMEAGARPMRARP